MGPAFEHCRFDPASCGRFARDAKLSPTRASAAAGRSFAAPRGGSKQCNQRHAAISPKFQRARPDQLGPARGYLPHLTRARSRLWQLVAGLASGDRHLDNGHPHSDARRKTQGVAILIASILIVPVTMVASVASIALLGASVSEHEKTQEKQIIENLRALSDAKAKWVAQTKVKGGAKVTVAGLAAYLDGREIKPIVGESYDPRPVGEEPTATLPAAKSLASHPKGAVLTASGSSFAIESSSSSSSEREDGTPSPGASPEEL